MPKLKPGHISPTDEEDAAINAAIADDPDTEELTEEFFKNSKTVWEMFPDIADDLVAYRHRRKAANKVDIDEPKLAHV